MKKLRIWLALAGLMVGVLVATSFGRALADPAHQDDGLPDGAFVARIYYEDIRDLEALARYDMHEYNNLQERYVLVSMDRTIYHELVAAGWRLAVDEEATANLTASRQPFYGGYRTVEEIYDALSTVSTTYPDITELVDYGDSYCKMLMIGCTTGGGEVQPGHDLLALRITNEAIPGPKPVFVLVANIHAREITTPELALRAIRAFVLGYGVNADVTWIVDHQETWIVPSVNPDGHWLVELGEMPPYNGDPFYQRKNTNRSNGCNQWPPTSFLQYGIDLNRNHTFMWNTGGSSNFPCDQTYRGPSAGSEPEVYQLEALVASLIPDQRGDDIDDPAPPDTTGILITMHSYGDLVLWPWGNVFTQAPNYEGLKAIGDKMATYNGYQSCQAAPCLYVTSGTTDDWAYGELGIPAYTYEIGNQFMPPYDIVDDVQWPENQRALGYAAKIARTPYMLVQGPDARQVSAVDNGDGTFTLSAAINDTANGDDDILRAGYFVDQPYWNGGSVQLMAADDGNFNSPVEDVEAVVDTSGWSSGRHIVFVHGQDVTNAFGPAGAVFIDVP